MTKKERITKRLFELLPAGISWSVITSPIWGGLFFPVQIAYFILVFNAFWLYKSLSTALLFVIGFFKIKNGENTDWMGKLLRLEDIDSGLTDLRDDIQNVEKVPFDISRFDDSPYQKLPLFAKKIIFNQERKKTKRFLKREIKEYESMKERNILDWRKMHHIVILPFWKEPHAVLIRSLNALAQQKFPAMRISIVLGAEERHPPAYKHAMKLKKKYENKFENFWVNNHTLTPEEIVGKAANMASCGRFAKKKIEDLGWDKDYVTITSMDCDTQFDTQYFAYMTYLFITDKDRYTHFFAAPMVYYANIWKIPFYGRVANTMFTVVSVSTSVRVDKFIQVSSYSFSWRLLEDIEFWAVDIIPEDFHMFFKALFLHGDKVYTVPIYLKNLSDAAESIGHRQTIKNQYEQVKRWAWGVSDDGWMIRMLLKTKKKTLYMVYRVFHSVFDHFSWSFISFILLFGANIPPLVNKNFNMTVLGQKLPKVSSFMLTASSVAFVFIILLDFFLKPRRDKKTSIFKIIFEQFQWFTLPLVGFVFGALPGLEAQTRLLFKKYLEYRLTEKH